MGVNPPAGEDAGQNQHGQASEDAGQEQRGQARAGEVSRRAVLQYAGVGAGAVLAGRALAGQPARAATGGSTGSQAAGVARLARFADDPPFSFTYGGNASSTLLKRWRRTAGAVTGRPGRLEQPITWADPHSGLRVRADVVVYPGYNATEWTVYFSNTGTANSAQLSDVLAADTVLNPSTTTQYTLHHFNGSADLADDYAPIDTALSSGTSEVLYPNGGRPSNGTWPYFNASWGGHGVMAAIGWPGQWTAQFTPDPGRGLVLQAGMSSRDPAQGAYDSIGDAQLLDTVLEPGEQIRTPLIVVMNWAAADWTLAQNTWRHWMWEYNLPRFGGSLPEPIAPTTGGLTLYPTQQQELSAIDEYVAHGTTTDHGGFYTHWWIDAGWYEIPDGSTNWADGVGNWFPDPTRFPQGMGPTFTAAARHGMKSLLWSEPERVRPDTWVATHHPDWLIAQPGVAAADQTYLLNFGNPAALTWLISHFDWLIKTQGATGQSLAVFRQDFNMDPLSYWNTADTPGRTGMTQIRHVLGHLAFWDTLKQRHPAMWVDSCASGGRRNDLETMRRAVPLLRSDYQFEPVGNQSQTYGLSFWLPYYGTGVGPQATNDGAWGSPEYVVLSSLAPCYASSVTLSTVTDADWAELRSMNEIFLKIKDDLLYSDFYPLTPFSLDNDVWLAFQFDRPGAGSGAVQVFRRADATSTSVTLKLAGLNPGRRYTVQKLNGAGGTQTATGQSLRQQGLTVSLPEAGSVAVFRYSRA
jgi:alpha-galactosidase